jgi:hypothetical protein
MWFLKALDDRLCVDNSGYKFGVYGVLVKLEHKILLVVYLVCDELPSV